MSGLRHTTAIVEESTFGTIPSLTGIRGFEVDSNTLQWDKTVTQGTGLRGGGLVARSSRRNVVARQAAGEIVMDFATKGMGLLLKHAFGTAAIAQIGVTSAFKQTFTLSDRATRSLTIQAGHPLVDGSLQPFTFSGCKLASVGISADNRDQLKFRASVDARDCTTATAYATPSYTLSAAADVFSFAGAYLYVAGSSTPVASNMQFGFELEHPMDTERFHTGQAGLKGEQLNNGWVKPVITAENEYADQITWVARNFTDETFRIEQLYEGPIITGTTRAALRIITPAVKIDGENPTVDGPEILRHTITMPVLDNGVDAAVTVEYTSSDTVV